MPPTTYDLSLAIYYLLPTTRYLLPTTCYLPTYLQIGVSKPRTLEAHTTLSRPFVLSKASLSYPVTKTLAESITKNGPSAFCLDKLCQDQFLLTLTYQPTYFLAHLPTYLPTYLLPYLPTHLPTDLLTDLAIFLPTYIPINLRAYLPTYLPTYLLT